MKHNPILITGIERSGSTIIAKILAQCGVFVGTATAMGENYAIKVLVNNYYSNTLGIPMTGQNPLPNMKELPIPVNWEHVINNILQEGGCKKDIPWIYKSSRIAQIWPVWNSTYPEAKWIIVRRKTTDIIHSCLQTGFMSAYSDYDGWLGWIKEHELLFQSMIQSGLNYKEVWPERMVNGDFSQIQEVIQWLGLEWNNEIPDIVKVLLKNSPQKRKELLL